MIQFIQAILRMIPSFFVVCIFFIAMREPFKAFISPKPFPSDSSPGTNKRTPLEWTLQLMAFQVVVLFLALFIGSPALSFSISTFSDQLLFVSIIFIIFGIFRLFNIVYPEAKSQNMIYWCCIAVGIISYAIISIPNFMDNTLSKITSLDDQQLQIMSSLVFFGTFFITIIVELIGALYKYLDKKFSTEADNLTH
jgi:hypothetical protein